MLTFTSAYHPATLYFQQLITMKIRAKKLTKKSLFKLILICSIVPFGLFFFLCGIASYFGSETVQWNGQTVTGMNGLLTALLIYPLFVFVFTVLSWVGAVMSLWVYSWFGKLKLELVRGEIIDY